ncbi:hypothetical protein S7711_02124 [Stachybotrys chartarum IBT 7711]|uniref:Polynucleotide 5'-hydroxyl-kinase GRC3 n=1 Tax=Stachybotrys chartarum (strain CBS 109288 / IBT 7711) TaxID=1280523 RepID=A0A084ARI4_STACB|nr:hypothetical protein S7711_02124 [Stachybotrys chartarum IBT 7711]
MSSSKRRKLEPEDAAKQAGSPVSAVSALAARRRLAEAAQEQPSKASTASKPPDTRANPFTPLQSLKGKEHGKAIPPLAKPNRGASRRREEAAADGKGQRWSRIEEQAGNPSDVVIPAKSIQYSSFRPSKRNHLVKAGGVIELRLAQTERFMVLGTFGVRVLTGEVTVLGSFIRASETVHWVSAPHCYAVPVLRTSENTSLELHNDPNTNSLRGLGPLSPLFRGIWNEASASSRRSTFQILYSSDDAPKRSLVQDLVSPPAWNQKLAALVAQTRRNGSWAGFICGPKSSGKSTFSKLLANRLLTCTEPARDGVAIIDLDPGQPEFCPAGTLSLVHLVQPNFGPPFTHMDAHRHHKGGYKVVRWHPLASVTPASAPDLYMECTFDLINTYRKVLAGRPLLINTPGWILGTGLELLVEIIKRLNPDEVIYMSEDGPADTVEALRDASKKTFSALPSQQSEFTSRTAAHLRAMQTLSYFHTANSEDVKPQPTPSWSILPLSSISPWIVRYWGPNKSLTGILCYDYQAQPDLLAETINGMVLAAVEIEDEQAFRGLSRTQAPAESSSKSTQDLGQIGRFTDLVVVSTPEGIPYIPNPDDVALDPQFSRCIGLVLVRGIDKANGAIHLLTPIPQSEIKEIKSRGRDIVLVHGKFDAPTWAYTEELYRRSSQEEGSGIGVEVMDEDTDEDCSDEQLEDVALAHDVTATPWVESLRENEKRPIGSRVWRVRRDLGRGNGDRE